MCGIFALSRASQSSIADSRRFVLAALIAIESRGYDSVGVAYTHNNQTKIWYDKRVGTATKEAGNLDLSANMRTVIGHTRWSTQGAHTYDNAHPVVADNVVLVHNGMLSNDDELDRLAAVPRVGEVDSWALAAIIQNAAAIGAAHPCDVLDLVRGDAAVAWMDSTDTKVLHLARLTGRPMCIGYTKRGDLVMSSTRETLQRTARLAEVTIGDMVDIPAMTYLAVRDGKIVEWRTIGKAEAQTAVPTRRVVIRSETPGKRGSRRGKHQRSYSHGITDLVELRPQSWWDEAAEQLGDDWADDNWPTGIELIRDRPRNRHGW